MRLSALLLAAISAAAPAARGLPGIPEDLLNHSAVTCIRIDDSGKVAGAYIVQSTGDAHRDQELVAWVKKLHWPKVKAGDKSRNMWFAMPIAFGDVIPPDAPASCKRR